MKGTEAAAALIDALETCGVPYMIVGSLSSNLFGITRSTVDADFVVELGAGDLKRVVERLGPAFSLDPQTQFETLTGTTRYIVHVAETEFKLELFCLSNDPHDRERFKRRLQMEMPDLGRIAYVPTPEDVILMKSRWARGKDRDDVRDVISVQGDAIDWDYVYHWADQHGTRGVIDEIRASIPPIDD